MVSNQTLATFCVLTGLFEYIQYSGAGIKNSIAAYTKRIYASFSLREGLAISGGLPGWSPIEESIGPLLNILESVRMTSPTATVKKLIMLFC